MIKVDDNLMWEQYMEESRLGKLAAGAALGGSLIGGAIGMNTPAYANTSDMSKITQPAANVAKSDTKIDTKTFVSLWSKYYQTSNDAKKEKNAFILSSEDINIPKDAQYAIYDAVYIMGGNMGVNPLVLKDILEKTGYVESLRYTQNKQFDGGPARSYWQVEPKTALDLITNSRALFGAKFRRAFKDKADKILNLKIGNDADYKYIQQQLETDATLAATFAAAKWIAAASSELKELK